MPPEKFTLFPSLANSLVVDLSFQESYAMLHKYGQSVAKEEVEKVDTLRYTWEKLLSRSTEVQNELVSLQPNFRGELIDNVETFLEDCSHFYQDYDQVTARTQGWTLIFIQEGIHAGGDIMSGCRHDAKM